LRARRRHARTQRRQGGEERRRLRAPPLAMRIARRARDPARGEPQARARAPAPRGAALLGNRRAAQGRRALGGVPAKRARSAHRARWSRRGAAPTARRGARAGGFVFHAPAGRLHLFLAPGAAQASVERLATHGFTLIAARGCGEIAPVLPPQQALLALRARIRAELDPAHRFALGDRWERGAY